MDRKIKWTDQKEVRFELAVDITQQRKYEGMLENRLRYEKNIVRFSNTLFLDKPDVIQEGLPYILTAANCSRVYISSMSKMNWHSNKPMRCVRRA